MNLKKQTLISTLGNIINLFSLWLLTVITTRTLGYQAVGELTLAMSVGNVFTFIQLYGVRNYQSSDITQEFSTGDYIWARIITTVIGMMLCVTFVICGGYSFSIGLSIILFTLFRTFEAVSDVFFGDIQKAGHLEFTGISLTLRGCMTVLLFLLGVREFCSLNKALMLIVGGSLFLTFTLDLYLYKRLVPLAPGTIYKSLELLKKCFPLLLAVLLPVVITTFPRIVLERYSGAELLGFYGNISTPAVIITTIVPSILAALMPIYGELVIKKEYIGIRKLWLKTIASTGGILILAFLGVLILGKQILSWIYTDAIIPYVHYLYAVLISTGLYALTMCGASVLIALRKNAEVSTCAIAATVVCVLLTVPLVRMYGIKGAILVLIISYFFQTVLQARIIVRETGKD